MKQNNLSKNKKNEIEKLLKDKPEILDQYVSNNPEIIQMIEKKELLLHSGPIPSPEVLKDYGDIDPTFPDRIVQMAEKQSNHRMTMEKNVVKSSIISERIGMILGSFLSLLSIAGGIYLAINDKNVLGFTAILAPIASILSAFLASKKSETKEVEKNNEELE